MLGLDWDDFLKGRPNPSPPLDWVKAKNKQPQKVAKRNHMKTRLAWISRQRFSLLDEPNAIQLLGRLLASMLPQSMARSLAESTMASMKVSNTARMSRGRMRKVKKSDGTKAATMPYNAVIQDHAATKMVKFMALVAELEALMLLTMTLPMRAVMRRVSITATARRRPWKMLILPVFLLLLFFSGVMTVGDV